MCVLLQLDNMLPRRVLVLMVYRASQVRVYVTYIVALTIILSQTLKPPTTIRVVSLSL